MRRQAGRWAMTMALALLVSAWVGLSAFAATETRVSTEDGGYVTVTNIAEEMTLDYEDGPYTILLANGPATVAFHGEQFATTRITYYPKAELKGDEIVRGDQEEKITVQSNGTLIDKPGYYLVFATGEEYTSSNTASFAIHVVAGATGGTKTPTPSPAPNKPAATTATPTASKVLVDGKAVSFEAYNIDGNNFFKLRDLAMAMNGTAKPFAVSWDGANNAISLTSGKPYTPEGNELAASAKPAAKQAVPAAAKLFVDGKEVALTAYNIDDNNYFKLRDIGKAIDFGVAWDAEQNTIGIDSASAYRE